MKKLLITLLLLTELATFAQSVGDTIVVKAFKYGSATRDTSINFPNNSLTYEKIIMKYNMRCKNGLVSTQSNRNLGCGEWDYSCNTYIADSSRTENAAQTHPSHIISNFSGSTYYYTNFPLYDYYLYNQTNVTLNSVITETQTALTAGIIQIPELLKTNEKSGRSQVIYTAAELAFSGFTAGNIDGILLNCINAGGTASFFNLNIKHTTLSNLSAATPQLTGFTNVYNANYTFTNSNNRIMFHTPFVWNGVDNIILDFSFTNATPSTPIMLIGKSTLTSVEAIYANNNYALNLSAQGHVNMNTSSLNTINNQITVSFWAYGNSSMMPTNTSILYATSANPNERNLNIHLPWSNSNVYFDCGYSGGGYDRISKISTAANNGGQWNHWAFTKNTTTGWMRIYLNGAVWAIGNGKSKPISIMNMILGKDNTLNNNYKGKINQLSIWDKELPQSEIQAIMNSSVTASHPSYSNLKAYYPMMEGSGLTINDIKSLATSTGTNVNWAFDRGNKLNRMFNELYVKPNITFVRGSYSITTTTVTVKDSIARDPNVVQSYSITSNATVTPMKNDSVTLVSTNNNYYNAAPLNVYDGDSGILTGTLAVTPTGSINITNLNYFTRHPYYIELMSFVTPYGIGLDLGMQGKSWYFDMSDYAPLLKGRKRFLMTMGGEWQEQMDIDFYFIVGTPPRTVLDCHQLWQGGARLGGVGIGSITNDTRFETQTLTMNNSASSFKMRSTITGHGAEGEFHQNGGLINHYFNINGGANEFNWQLTRPCAGNPIYPQGGTWVYDRQGWCPGEYSLLKEYYITPYVTPGSTVTLDYNTSTPPVSGGDYRYIAAHQLISYSGPNHNLDAAMINVRKPGNYVEYLRENPMCSNPVIIVRNTGSVNISSLDIEYWINNTATKETFTWTGNLAFMDTTSITLPIGTLWQNAQMNSGKNYFNVELKKANSATDNYSYNNKMAIDFSLPDVITDTLTVEFKTNNNPFENSYKLVDANGNVVPGASSLVTANTTYIDNYLLNGCYKLIVEDTGEDGLQWWASTAQGAGYVRFKNAQGTVIKTFQTDFGKGFEYSFSTKPFAYVGIKENDLNYNVRLYPNPARNQFVLSMMNTNESKVQITDMLGRNIELPFVLEKESYTFNTTSLKAGVYLVKITQNEKSCTKKLVIE